MRALISLVSAILILAMCIVGGCSSSTASQAAENDCDEFLLLALANLNKHIWICKQRGVELTLESSINSQISKQGNRTEYLISGSGSMSYGKTVIHLTGKEVLINRSTMGTHLNVNRPGNLGGNWV